MTTEPSRASTPSSASPSSSAPSARRLLVNNLVAAVLACTVMIFVHELAHLVTGLVLGYPGVFVAFGVLHVGEPTAVEAAIMALAGPAFSLVTGLVMMFWMPLQQRRSFGHLVWLWFAFVSVQEAVTYLCLTPFGAGDTGDAARLLGLPVVWQFVALAIGVGGMFFTARMFAPHLFRYAGTDARHRNAMGLFVWLYGMIAIVALTFVYLLVVPVSFTPGEQIAVMVGGTALLVFAPMANIFHRQVAGVAPVELRLPAVPVAGLVVLGVFVIINVLLSLFAPQFGVSGALT